MKYFRTVAFSSPCITESTTFLQFSPIELISSSCQFRLQKYLDSHLSSLALMHLSGPGLPAWEGPASCRPSPPSLHLPVVRVATGGHPVHPVPVLLKTPSFPTVSGASTWHTAHPIIPALSCKPEAWTQQPGQSEAHGRESQSRESPGNKHLRLSHKGHGSCTHCSWVRGKVHFTPRTP